MGIMTFLRNRAGFIVISVIGLAILAFIVGDVAKTGQPFWAASQNEVGKIDGTSVDYQAFQTKVDQQKAQLEQQYGSQMSNQVQSMAVENIWNQEISTVLLQKEFDKLGIQVSPNELFNLIQGDQPSPLIRQYFTDPQTGQFNIANVRAALEQRKSNPKMEQQWIALEDQIEQQALQAKYTNLVRSGIYVTNVEADEFNKDTNKTAQFSFVGLDYTTVADKDAVPTDADYQTFYDANAGMFKNPQESRDFQYVVFNAVPSAQDSSDSKKQIDQLAEDFKKSTNDSLFAAINSDVKVPFQFLSKGKLDPAVEAAVFNLPAGSFYGPVLSNGSYKLAKVIATTMQPDSVNASHILINPTALGGVDKALKLADSLKKVIEAGGKFEDLAARYSTDGSKDKGGELGTFTSDRMIPEFSKVAFSSNPGELKIITSQYGVHLLKVNRVFGSSKVVKLAYIQKDLAPSSTTQEIAYKKASSFLNQVNGGADFAKTAAKEGNQVQLGDKVTAMQATLMGLTDPRKIIQDVWKAKSGQILNQVYTNDNANVVVKLTAINAKGQLPLAAVKNNLTPIVKNIAKARILKEKMNKAFSGATDLNQIATKLASKVNLADHISLDNPVITSATAGVSQEPELIGAVFASPANKLSKAVVGQKGVYVFNVAGFTTSAPTTNYTQIKLKMISMNEQTVLSGVMKVLQDQAEIKDNRVNFY